jgi:hypothetical protein
MGGGRQARMLPACVWPMCDEGGRSSHEQRQCCGGVRLAVIDEEDIGVEKERRRVTVVKGAGCRREITSQILAVMLSGSAVTP